MKLETGQPLRIKFMGQEFLLYPGKAFDLPEDHVPRLLKKATCRVWWTSPETGKVCGPALMDFLNHTEDGHVWVFMTEATGWRAIRSDFIARIVLFPRRNGVQ